MQLYRAITPAAVQRAEARTMQEMEQPPPRTSGLRALAKRDGH